MDEGVALLVGNLIGLLYHLADDDAVPLARTEVEPITDGPNYTNQIRVTRPSGSYLITVEKEQA
jgi:hypothetical protein